MEAVLGGDEDEDEEVKDIKLTAEVSKWMECRDNAKSVKAIDAELEKAQSQLGIYEHPDLSYMDK